MSEGNGSANRPAGRKGLVIVNTGDGKGKTTAALGIVLRAWGRGLRTCVIQFIKSEDARYGEIRAAEKLGIEWLANVHFAHVQRIEPRVLIIGVGNTAMDCCRTAKRVGATDVKVYAKLEFANPGGSVKDRAARQMIVVQWNRDVLSRTPPPWLDSEDEGLSVKVREYPLREHIDVPVREQLIVELYSK